MKQQVDDWWARPQSRPQPSYDALYPGRPASIGQGVLVSARMRARSDSGTLDSDCLGRSSVKKAQAAGNDSNSDQRENRPHEPRRRTRRQGRPARARRAPRPSSGRRSSRTSAPSAPPRDADKKAKAHQCERDGGHRPLQYGVGEHIRDGGCRVLDCPGDRAGPVGPAGHGFADIGGRLAQSTASLLLGDGSERIDRIGDLLGEMGDIVFHGREVLLETRGSFVLGYPLRGVLCDVVHIRLREHLDRDTRAATPVPLIPSRSAASTD